MSWLCKEEMRFIGINIKNHNLRPAVRIEMQGGKATKWLLRKIEGACVETTQDQQTHSN